MNGHRITLADILPLAKQLTPLEKVRLIEQVASDLEASLEALSTRSVPLRSSYGICADLGPAPSSEDLAAIRQEMCAPPRETRRSW
jgi:hypothetical protein